MHAHAAAVAVRRPSRIELGVRRTVPWRWRAATGRLAVVRFLVQTVVSLNNEASAAGSGADRGQQQHCGASGVSSNEEFAHIVSLTRTASDGYGLRLSRAGIILDVTDA